MKIAIAVLVTILIMCLLTDLAREASLKRSAEIGYIIADKRAFRLVPLELK